MAAESFCIYHNAHCSKSNSACALLAERGVAMEVVDYLTTPPTADELRELLGKLGMKPGQLLRRGEALFIELYGGRELTDYEAFAALLAHPILMERPIVVRGDKAVVARPPERALELLSAGGVPEAYKIHHG